MDAGRLEAKKKRMSLVKKLGKSNLRKSCLLLDFIATKLEFHYADKYIRHNDLATKKAVHHIHEAQEFLFDLLLTWYDANDPRIYLRNPKYARLKWLKETKKAIENFTGSQRLEFLSNEIKQVLLWLDEVEEHKFPHDAHKLCGEWLQLHDTIRRLKLAQMYLRTDPTKPVIQ